MPPLTREYVPLIVVHAQLIAARTKETLCSQVFSCEAESSDNSIE